MLLSSLLGSRIEHSRSNRTAASFLVSLLAIAAFAIPTVANAASSTLTLSGADAPGLSGSVTVDDMAAPGNLSFSISLLSIALPAEAIADLRGVFISFSSDDLFPDLSASGTDVFASAFTQSSTVLAPDLCRCDLEVDLGSEGFFLPTGLESASFVVEHPSIALTLTELDLEEITLVVGISEGDTSRVAKLKGNFAINPKVIPEPSTAVLMMLGLSGLSLTSRRLRIN